ncbi:MAG: 1-acyl-sn-glycerol-3-phosphate acyltransferase [Marmoricola sp.]|nr:1-acyl-sn-glycerol-3-phosphate acyltransferase [Marmoricola sp.]
MSTTVSCDLPRTHTIKHPPRLALHRLRPAFAAVAHRRWDITQVGTENVPGHGPVVLAANHIGFLDGPLMAIVGPRPVHALTKRELYSGPLGAFLTVSGQIPVDRDEPDPLALKTALRVLRDGGVAGLFPERTRGSGEVLTAAGGAAYLAMASGATVVPMAFLGTRLPGTSSTFPPARTRIVMTYGEPLTIAQQGWPRRQSDVRALTETIRQAIITNVRAAEAATGMTLPGPLPDDENSQDAP